MPAELIKHIDAWGKTSGDVLREAQTEVYHWNNELPFGEGLPVFDLILCERNVREFCYQATASRRKGMMISSQFRVDRTDTEVQIWHVRNEYEPRLFLSIRKAQ